MIIMSSYMFLIYFVFVNVHGYFWIERKVLSGFFKKSIYRRISAYT